MKRSITTLLLGLAILVSVGIAAAQQDKAEKLYQEGLYQMEGMGDFTKAIEIFNRVVAEFPKEKPTAAKALLHIGFCYEKMGMQEAQKAFQSVVDKYPEQTQEVALAKERLAKIAKALAEETRKPSFRKIRIPANPGNGVLSPDGKLLAFISQGSVWVVPIHGKVQPDLAGEPVRLTEPLGATNIGNIMAWSGDGQWIAFNAVEDQKVVIYVVSASGGKLKKIPADLLRRGGNAYNYRLSLSADGKTLAFCSADVISSELKPEKIEPFLLHQLYTIPVDGGAAKRLTVEGATEPAFSPDGKRIAFVRPILLENGKVHKDLWVMNSDGNKSVKMTELAGSARGPAWSPDGKMIAFHYEPKNGRSFSNEIWIVSAPAGQKPGESPTKIKLPLESYSMIAGWTIDQKIGVLLASPQHQAVYTVPAAGGKATQVSPETATRFTGSEDFEGYPSHPRWSPDGKTIYFRWGKGHIVAVPSQGGTLSQIHSSKDTKLIGVLPGGGNDVSPDGKRIVFSAYKEGTRPYEVNIWTVPAEGGKPTQITKGLDQDRYPSWSPDGKRIAFIRTTEKSKDEYVMNIYIVPAEGGEVRQLTTEADRVSYASIRWAPDGDQIAYFSRDKTINVKPLQGGEPRIIVNVDNVHGHCELSWSPDGKELAYTSKGRIMVVPIGGGEPREIKTGILNEEVQNFHINWSPDGKKFAFTAGFGGDEELWLMENFLPKQDQSHGYTTPLTRQVWAGADVDIEGGVSPDGRYLTFVDWGTGDLAIRDFATGEKRRLTNKGSWNDSEEFAQSSIVSPDSKQIAYAWYNKAEFYDLRLIGSDGSNPRVLYRSEELEFIRPADWSPDGKQILAALFRRDKPLQLGLISVADGSVRILKTIEARDPYLSSGPLFSPDGRYVAYSLPPRSEAAEQDISLLAIDGKHEVALVQHPANDYLLGWSRDGKRVIFASDRAGTTDAWVIGVVDGKPQGVPQLVKRNMGSVSPMGLTQKGSFYYATPGLLFDIFTITLDPATGKIITTPNKEPLPFEGYNMSPGWSPDGKYLLYTSRRGPMNRRPIICIYSPETGKVRELLARLELVYPRWTPEGGSILAQAYVTSGQGIYRMDVTTGEVVPFIPRRKEGKEYLQSAQLSPNGKLVFYIREDQKTKICQVLVRNLETGQEKELDRATSDNHSIALSPDGRRLALLIRAEKQLRVLKVMPSNGREQIELHRFEQGGRWIIDIAWSPDSRYIFFSRERPDGKWGLWRISSGGGEAQDLGLAMRHFQNLSVHPDGRRITFASRPTEAERNEIWVMENFLPKEDKTQK